MTIHRTDDHRHAHDHDHDHHGHDHSHGVIGHHAHAPKNFGAAFAAGIGLNGAFVVVEAVYGVLGHSMSLLADAGHNLSDVLGLTVAYVASRLALRAATRRFTYGFRSSSILAALFNAVFLLVIVGGLIWEAVLRLFNPEPVAGATVMVVAAIGIAVNGITAWLFASGRDRDINIKAAYLHMAADALVSVGVVVAGGLILLTGWLWIDPLTSLVVNGLIVAATYGLLRDSVTMALQAVPAAIEPDKVQGVPGPFAGRDSDARPAHLAHQHHRDRNDRPPGDARRASRRSLPRGLGRGGRDRVRGLAHDLPDRDQRRADLPARFGRCTLHRGRPPPRLSRQGYQACVATTKPRSESTARSAQTRASHPANETPRIRKAAASQRTTLTWFS